MCAASRVTTWPTRTTRLGALEILTRPRVHFDLVAALDEERNVHAQPRLDGRGLRRAGGGVAFQPEVRVGDLEHHRGREIHPDRRPFVLVEHRGHPVGWVEFVGLVGGAVDLDGHAGLDLPGGYHLLSFGGWGAEPPTFASSQRRACSYPTTPRPMN